MQKPPREPQGYQRYRTSGRETTTNQMKKENNNVDQQACRWSQHHKNCAGEHPRPVSSLLKGIIRQKNNEKTKLSNAATENRTCKPTSCIGITPGECSFSKEQSYRDPKQTVKNYKNHQGNHKGPKISNLRAGNHSKSNEEGKLQCRSTSMSMITTSQELHRWASATGFVLAQGTHQAEELCSFDKKLFFWQGTHQASVSSQKSIALFFLKRNTRLAWCLCMMSVCKFCSPSLHCFIWFSRCSFAWWVPRARTKPVADAHLCNSCDVVIIDMLVDQHCFFPSSNSFLLKLYEQIKNNASFRSKNKSKTNKRAWNSDQ